MLALIPRQIPDRPDTQPRGASRGFSLIELAVVVAIIGILAAIAIPTFLGQREGAQDRQIDTALRNLATQARAYAVQRDANYDYDTADLQAALEASEPTFAGDMIGVSMTGNELTPFSVTPMIVGGFTLQFFLDEANPTQMVWFGLSASGNIQCLRDDLSAGTVGPQFSGYTVDDLAGVGTGTMVSEACAFEGAPEGPTAADILVAFKAGLTPGAEWATLDNWGSSADPCIGPGWGMTVSCSGGGDVVAINLAPGTTAGGVIPDELMQLTELTTLVLHDSCFTASGPTMAWANGLAGPPIDWC